MATEELEEKIKDSKVTAINGGMYEIERIMSTMRGVVVRDGEGWRIGE